MAFIAKELANIKCNHRVHQGCTNLRVLKEDPDFTCQRCSRSDTDPPQPQLQYQNI